MKIFNEERTKRIKKLSVILWLLLAGIIYLIWVRITDLRIPCIFYILTDKYCPGCGVTRMIVALSKFDFKGAFSYNPLVLCLLPFLAFISIQKIVKYIKSGKAEDSLPVKIFYIIAFVLCIAFWILRNTEGFAWMAP